MEIKKGDRVKITLSENKWVIGTVIRAINNNFGQRFIKESGVKSDWYIELNISESTIPKSNSYQTVTSYAYWNQGVDGGTVEHAK